MEKEIPQYIINEMQLALGRKILPSEVGNRNSLAEFTSKDIEDIRIIGNRNTICANVNIRFRIKRRLKLGLAHTYYEDVVKNGRPFEEWNKYKPPLDEQFIKD